MIRNLLRGKLPYAIVGLILGLLDLLWDGLPFVSMALLLACPVFLVLSLVERAWKPILSYGTCLLCCLVAMRGMNAVVDVAIQHQAEAYRQEILSQCKTHGQCPTQGEKNLYLRRRLFYVPAMPGSTPFVEYDLFGGRRIDMDVLTGEKQEVTD